MNPTLLPCPFCGGAAEVVRVGDRHRSAQVKCWDCGCTVESNEHGVGDAWNRRQKPTHAQSVGGALGKVVAYAEELEDSARSDLEEGLREPSEYQKGYFCGQRLAAHRLRIFASDLRDALHTDHVEAYLTYPTIEQVDRYRAQVRRLWPHNPGLILEPGRVIVMREPPPPSPVIPESAAPK